MPESLPARRATLPAEIVTAQRSPAPVSLAQRALSWLVRRAGFAAGVAAAPFAKEADWAPRAGTDFARGITPYGYPPLRGSKDLLALGKKNPWLFATTTRISTAVASVPWRLYAAYDQKTGRPSKRGAQLYRQRRRFIRAMGGAAQSPISHRLQRQALAHARAELGVEEITEFPLLDLLDQPNPLLTGHQVSEVTQRHLDLVGEAFWYLERDPVGGFPIRLWPIPNYWVIRTPSDGFNGFDIFYNGIRVRASTADVIWMRYPDPLNPYARGTWAGQALGDEIETDEYAAKMGKANFFRGGTPSGIVSVDGAGDEQLNDMSARWEDRFKGWLNAFSIAFVDGKTKFTQITPDFGQSGILDVRTAKKADFRGIYGVPPELTGETQNSNRAAITGVQTIFAVYTLVPRLDFRLDVLEQQLLPQFDDSLVLEYESPVPDDRDFDLGVFSAQPGAYTLNEWRDLTGRPPIEGFDEVYGTHPTGGNAKPDGSGNTGGGAPSN